MIIPSKPIDNSATSYCKEMDKAMQKKLLDVLGKTCYIARKECIATGVYPARAFFIPNSNQFFSWEELPESIADPVQWIYRKEGEAAVHVFLLYVRQYGSAAAKDALKILEKELEEVLYSDEERARAESEQS